MPKIKDLPKDMAKKKVSKKLKKQCACCGKNLNVFVYSDKSYRGGHYFGKVPHHSEKEISKALKIGAKQEKLGASKINVFKKDPKPYKYTEYWECPGCYWGK